MRKLTTLAAAVMALATLAFAPAANGFCYDADVVVNGDAVVDEADCVELP